MANQLGRCKQNKTHLDLAFKNGAGKKIGEIRLKPNRVLWSRSGSRLWRGVSLNAFIEFMKRGEKQTR